MDDHDERDSAPPLSVVARLARRRARLHREPEPGAPPGTLVVEPSEERARIFLIDYDARRIVEKEIDSIDECIPYITDDSPSITWIDVRGLSDRKTLERMGEVFEIHPLALEDVVNVPQRPKTDIYEDHQLIISRMVQIAEGRRKIEFEQVSILFGKDFVLTVQEDPKQDVFESVRERIRKGRGMIRKMGADHLAYALLDAIIDGFYPILEVLGEDLENLELEATLAPAGMSRRIHDIKSELLAVRRAIWPQRDLINGLLRDESHLLHSETRLYLRDTYDHAVQVMELVETFREVASGLMDLYLSGISTRMNEIMKVLTIISTIFLPLTFIAGVYGMNFNPSASPYNMPELDWRYGYLFSLGLMALSVGGLLFYYRRKGWLGNSDEDSDSRKKEG